MEVFDFGQHCSVLYMKKYAITPSEYRKLAATKSG
jgi:hypothetical protein